MRAVEQASAAKQTSEWSNKYGDNENDYEIMHKAVKNRHAQMLACRASFSMQQKFE